MKRFIAGLLIGGLISSAIWIYNDPFTAGFKAAQRKAKALTIMEQIQIYHNGWDDCRAAYGIIPLTDRVKIRKEG